MMRKNLCLKRSERRKRSQLLATSRAMRPNCPRPLSEPKDLAGYGGMNMRMFETVAVEVVMNAG